MSQPSPLILSSDHTLSAAQCNAQHEMPLSLLVTQLIEAATQAADSLGFGLRQMQELGCLWVISRLSVEVNRFPCPHQPYSILTWVDSFNRRFSDRNFEITSSGQTIAYARSTWSVIENTSRRAADLSQLSHISDAIVSRHCPMPRPERIRPLTQPASSRLYQAMVSDIDFNRHVTTARYIQLAVDTLPLELYDRFFIHRFDIEFRHEICCSETVEILSSPFDEDTSSVLISINRTDCGHTPVCVARITLSQRHESGKDLSTSPREA